MTTSRWERTDIPQLRLRLPVPPSTNNLFVNVAGKVAGRTRVKGRQYAQWLHDAGWLLVQQVGRQTVIARPVAVLVECDLRAGRDMDNALKPVLDLLVRAGILADDNLVDDLRIVRRGEKREAVVSIWLME